MIASWSNDLPGPPLPRPPGQVAAFAVKRACNCSISSCFSATTASVARTDLLDLQPLGGGWSSPLTSNSSTARMGILRLPIQHRPRGAAAGRWPWATCRSNSAIRDFRASTFGRPPLIHCCRAAVAAASVAGPPPPADNWPIRCSTCSSNCNSASLQRRCCEARNSRSRPAPLHPPTTPPGRKFPCRTLVRAGCSCKSVPTTEGAGAARRARHPTRRVPRALPCLLPATEGALAKPVAHGTLPSMYIGHAAKRSKPASRPSHLLPLREGVDQADAPGKFNRSRPHRGR